MAGKLSGQDSSSVGTGEAHVFNTEDALLSNERLERSSPVLWPDSATLCEFRHERIYFPIAIYAAP